MRACPYESVRDGFVELADESLAAAESLLSGGYPRFAVARAYYTMFYSASALHLHHGRSYTKHSGVIAGFGRHFVKTGQFQEQLFRQFRKAFVDRQIGDYDAGASVSPGLAEETIGGPRNSSPLFGGVYEQTLSFKLFALSRLLFKTILDRL